MGMDYKYMGSASYPRFNDELEGIVKLLGGKTITKRKSQENCTIVEYFMEETLEYKMPKDAPKAVCKWVNNPYGSFNFDETYDIYTYLIPKKKEIEKISPQIIGELQSCIDCMDS